MDTIAELIVPLLHHIKQLVSMGDGGGDHQQMQPTH
jgi:hypothetical protein